MAENKTTKAEAVEEAEVMEVSVQDLNEEIEKLKEENEKYYTHLQRTAAEFDNYKKRNVKVWADAFTEGKTDILLKVLPIGDNIDIAISYTVDEKTKEGLVLLKRKFDEVLKANDVEEINPVGEQFDPNIAEAVMQVAGEEGEEADTVKQVFQKGYRLKEKIIRYAKVSVVK